jgi:hypothetical protein
MARFDKYDPVSGGFRAKLAADWAGTLGVPIGVGLDTSGNVVPGAGNTGILGVVIVEGQLKPDGTRVLNQKGRAGEVVDVMTDGEIVDLDSPTLTAGTVIYGVAATGVLTATSSGNVRLGATVEATRLVVRSAR